MTAGAACRAGPRWGTIASTRLSDLQCSSRSRYRSKLIAVTIHSLARTASARDFPTTKLNATAPWFVTTACSTAPRYRQVQKPFIPARPRGTPSHDSFYSAHYGCLVWARNRSHIAQPKTCCRCLAWVGAWSQVGVNSGSRSWSIVLSQNYAPHALGTPSNAFDKYAKVKNQPTADSHFPHRSHPALAAICTNGKC